MSHDALEPTPAAIGARDVLVVFFSVMGAALTTRTPLGLQGVAPWTLLAAGLLGVTLAGAALVRARETRPLVNGTAKLAAALTLMELASLALLRGHPHPSVAVAGVLMSLLLAIDLLSRRRAGDPLDSVVVFGEGPLARATAEHLEKRGRRVVGRVGAGPGAAPLVGEVDPEGSRALAQFLAHHPVGEVYVACHPMRGWPAMRAAVEVCETFGVPFALPAHGLPLRRARPVHARAVADGYLHYRCVEARTVERALKRLVDVVAAGAALLVLAPLLIGVAIAVKLTSRGPVLFRQRRVGLHGQPFEMLKFRSMVQNAEALREQLAALNEQTGPVFKMRRDPRVTPVGAFIRKYSIDELPQLLNVLRGEMSLVGPRPPIPREVETYEPWQRRRLSVKPGLTCIWQVSGRNEVSFEQWMYMDLQYIDHWNIARDFGLLLKTLPVVITGRGAS